MQNLRTITRYADLDWTGLRLIGRGRSKNAYAHKSGRTVVKVGRIGKSEVDDLRRLHEWGIGAPIYGFFTDVKLPKHIAHELDYYGHETMSVLICARVTVYADTFRDAAPRFVNKVDEAIDTLSHIVRQHRFDWGDQHDGNVGFYRGKPVIIDGVLWSR